MTTLSLLGTYLCIVAQLTDAEHITKFFDLEPSRPMGSAERSVLSSAAGRNKIWKTGVSLFHKTGAVRPNDATSIVTSIYPAPVQSRCAVYLE